MEEYQDADEQNPIGIDIAPLVGLWPGELREEEYQITPDLYLVKKPKIKIDDEWAEKIGSSGVSDLKRAAWGLKHVYKGDIGIHLGKKEEASDDFLWKSLLALWITKPTGARITHFLRYRRPWHSDKVTSISFYKDHFRFHRQYEKDSLSLEDLNQYRVVLEGVRNIFENKKGLTRTLSHLSGALHLWVWDARFTMFTVVLESLFSTDSQEISHKISERIAFFLEEEAIKRQDIFHLAKEIYRTRSKIVHGADLKISKEKSIKISGDLERLVQTILKKIFSDFDLIDIFSGKPNRREKFLTGLLFS